MTGPEFALAVLISVIANAIYDVLRNPSPPVPKDESKNLLQDSQELIRKIASRMLPSKKEVDARPVGLLDSPAISGRGAILKKSLQNLYVGGRKFFHSFVLPKKEYVPRPRVQASISTPFTACGPGTGMVSKPDLIHFGGQGFLKNA